MKDCPVCEKNDISERETFCSQCRWKFIFWATSPSSAEQEKYDKRIGVARKRWLLTQKMQKIKRAGSFQSEPEKIQLKREQNKYEISREVPDFERDVFETLDEYQKRLEISLPVACGDAELIRDKYDIGSGRFPLKIRWYEWFKNSNKMRDAAKKDGYQLMVKRDTARSLYEANNVHPVFATFRVHAAHLVIERLDLVCGDSLFSVQLPEGERVTGTTWRDPVTGMAFMWVPGGEFQMGDVWGGCYNDVEVVHRVKVSDFWLGRYAVTQGEWMAIMDKNPSKFKKGDRYPVESVTWEDAQEFISRLNTRSDAKFRLPTEAEWEYAARSGGKREKYSGSDSVEKVAWYDGNSDGTTHPVGVKKPNGLGLYDMSGNVWEWCQDCYDGDYYVKSPVDNPRGPESGRFRVKRGGSWYFSAWICRTVYRNYFSPDYSYSYLGFRLLREA